MPTIQGVTFTEAWAEAVAIAPINSVALVTLELNHPDFDEPARVVADRQDFTCTLEADAPYNPGQEVTFIALPVEVLLPEESTEGTAPSVSVSIGDVSQVITPYLEKATASLTPAELIVREYISTRPEQPARVPVIRMIVTDVSVTERRVTLQASYLDPANRGFPTRSYSSAEYPGLAAR